MGFWVNFWTGFFFLSLAVFTGLAIAVAIGGYFNIRSLFKSLKAEHEDTSLYEKDE